MLQDPGLPSVSGEEEQQGGECANDEEPKVGVAFLGSLHRLAESGAYVGARLSSAPLRGRARDLRWLMETSRWCGRSGCVLGGSAWFQIALVRPVASRVGISLDHGSTG